MRTSDARRLRSIDGVPQTVSVALPKVLAVALYVPRTTLTVSAEADATLEREDMCTPSPD